MSLTLKTHLLFLWFQTEAQRQIFEPSEPGVRKVRHRASFEPIICSLNSGCGLNGNRLHIANNRRDRVRRGQVTHFPRGPVTPFILFIQLNRSGYVKQKTYNAHTGLDALQVLSSSLSIRSSLIASSDCADFEEREPAAGWSCWKNSRRTLLPIVQVRA